MRNAFNALRRHRDPASVLDRPQYRPALPLVAAAVSEKCLAACVDRLGDHADDPTKEQLLEALDAIGGDFPLPTVAVMLASVADSHMPASDLCLEILTTDDRFGLTGEADGPSDEVTAGVADEARDRGDSALAEEGPTASTARPVEGVDDTGADGSQRREERRLRRRRDAEARRKRSDAARRSAEQVRRARRRRPEAPSHEARANSVVGAPTSNARGSVEERCSLRLKSATSTGTIPGRGRSSSRGSPSTAPRKARSPRARADGAWWWPVPRTTSSFGPATPRVGRRAATGRRSSSEDGGVPASTSPPGSTSKRSASSAYPEVTPVGWLSAEDWNALW